MKPIPTIKDKACLHILFLILKHKRWGLLHRLWKDNCDNESPGEYLRFAIDQRCVKLLKSAAGKEYQLVPTELESGDFEFAEGAAQYVDVNIVSIVAEAYKRNEQQAWNLWNNVITSLQNTKVYAGKINEADEHGKVRIGYMPGFLT